MGEGSVGGAQDHPRSRGEYLGRVNVTRGDSGSSPLSRGIPVHHPQRVDATGIIPALAGNTSFSARRRGRCPGSSPLSRGIRGGFIDKLFNRRIIPALAGNTGGVDVHGRHQWDHPRSRGEYVVAFTHSDAYTGSSPLSRGIPRNSTSPSTCSGIIPALAGNTDPLIRNEFVTKDHPRSRGEYAEFVRQIADASGSSPLSRGILHLSVGHADTTRIIPALAGNTRP